MEIDVPPVSEEECSAPRVDELLQSEPCNVCKLKNFGQLASERYGIPEEELGSYLSKLEECEGAFLATDNLNACAMNIKYYFYAISSALGLEGFITIATARSHLKECLARDRRNQCIANIRSLDKHIRVGLTLGMVYKENDEGQTCFDQDNVNTLSRLFYMKRQESLNLREFERRK